MATTYTTNYNLGKQENHADKFDMDVITDNADKIDAALTAKADKSTTYTKTEVDTALSGKQATLTTAQLDAVNSGITSADVTQIGVNENNISTINNNLIYSPTQPTGDIPDGAIWINTAITALSDYIKKYHVSQNILDESIIENNYTLDTTTGLPSTYNGRVATTTAIDVENYDILKITYNAAVSLMYSTFNANNELIVREINKSSGFTFNVSSAKYLYLCWYSSGNISKDVIGNIMLNAGTTVKPYEPYSAEIWHSNNA